MIMSRGYIEWWPEYKFPLIDWRACVVRSISPGTSCRSTSYWYFSPSHLSVGRSWKFELEQVFKRLSGILKIYSYNQFKLTCFSRWQSLKNWLWTLNVKKYFESFELVCSLTSSNSLFPWGHSSLHVLISSKRMHFPRLSI